MPRTVNLAERQVRREAFLDAAERLIRTQGYEQMSVQDVLDTLATSRGAFYHYFDSKQALLEAVVERFADAGLAAVSPVLADPDLPALRKLERLFGGIQQWKAEQKELVLAIVDVWNSDANAIVREKVRRLTAARLQPVLADVVREGVARGQFRVTAPEEAARVLVHLMQGYQDVAVDLFVGGQRGAVRKEDVRRTVAGLTEAFERILGLPAGSVTLMDEATLEFWFG